MPEDKSFVEDVSTENTSQHCVDTKSVRRIFQPLSLSVCLSETQTKLLAYLLVELDFVFFTQINHFYVEQTIVKERKVSPVLKSHIRLLSFYGKETF